MSNVVRLAASDDPLGDGILTEQDVRSIDDVASQVSALVKTELDKVLPHVVSALKANDATKAMAARLEATEKRLADRANRPVVSHVVQLLNRVRRLDFGDDAKGLITSELEAILVGVGYVEFGEVGDVFDPVRHEAVDGETLEDGAEAVIVTVFEPGLETLGEVVAPARVGVGAVITSHEGDPTQVSAG